MRLHLDKPQQPRHIPMIRPLIEVDLTIWGTETLFVQCGETTCGETHLGHDGTRLAALNPAHGNGQPVPVRKDREKFIAKRTHAFIHLVSKLENHEPPYFARLVFL